MVPKAAEGFRGFQGSLDYVGSKGSQEYQRQLGSQEYQAFLALVEMRGFQDFQDLRERMGYLESRVLLACPVRRDHLVKYLELREDLKGNLGD
ncbi:UNVERIFIED_CONTAM: hypothetical protein K2H54_047158 [Gekko kuhli]